MSSRPPRDLWAPISVWGHVWRGLLAAVTGTLLFLVSNDPQFSRPLASWVPFVDLVVGVLSLVLLPLHRRSPLLVPVLLQAMTAVSTSSGGSASVALVSVATRRRWPRIALAGVVAMLASLAVSRIYPEIDPMPTALNVATMVLVLAAQIAWGLYLGARRDLFATWQWRAETAEREQVQRISSAREAERTRIAREMHDVLAHRISLVSMHAGALAYRDDLSREQIRKEATIIQGTSMQALTELRQILGVLRSTPVGEPQDAVEAPQPTFTDADDLVLRALRAGASGFLLKDTPPPQIVQAIHRVRAGEPTLSPSVTQRLIHAVSTRTSDTRQRRASTLVAGLTDRERQIALAIGEGRTNAGIAASLYLSVATVKSHVTHLLTKLEADNRVQIAIRMHDAGLL